MCLGRYVYISIENVGKRFFMLLQGNLYIYVVVVLFIVVRVLNECMYLLVGEQEMERYCVYIVDLYLGIKENK